MSGFDAAVNKFAAKALDRVRRTRGGFVENLFQAVVDHTPVDTGMLRSNWQSASGRRPQGLSGLRGESAVEAEIASAAASVGDNDGEMFLVNNLPYAAAVEYGYHGAGGPAEESRKSPAGMLRGALAEAPALLGRAAGKVKSS